VSGLAQALLNNKDGDPLGLVGKILVKQLQSAGEDLIMDAIGGPLCAAKRVAEAVRTGGQSEFDRTRTEFLHSLKPSTSFPGSGIIRTVGGLFEKRAKRVGRYRPGTWQASSWASSREDWLQNRWMHDWRSQPRDERGRWVPGRLQYIEAHLQYRGKRAGRVVLRRRKRRKLRRLMTRREFKKLLKKRQRDGY